MSQTTTPARTDTAMWRRLFLRVHPDQGGDGELFVWARELQERVMGGCEACPEPDQRAGGEGGSSEGTERVDFPDYADHDRITSRALHMAAEVSEPYARLLEVLADCTKRAPAHIYQERRGASYKQLALIAHLAGMSKTERVGWYEVARSVPLSQRHAGYLIERLEGTT